METDVREKPRRPKPGTQRAEVLAILEVAGGQWVPLNRLLVAASCGAAHSVIDALRTFGWRIENDCRERIGGRVRSRYRLLTGEQEGGAE